MKTINVGKITLNSSNAIFVSKCELENFYAIDIRHYFLPKDDKYGKAVDIRNYFRKNDEFHPTKKGARLSLPDKWLAFSKIIKLKKIQSSMQINTQSKSKLENISDGDFLKMLINS